MSLDETKEPDVGEKGALPTLDAHETSLIEQQLRVGEAKVGYFSLYKYATTGDVIIIILCALSSVATGAVLPLTTASLSSITHTGSNIAKDCYWAVCRRIYQLSVGNSITITLQP